LKRRERRRARPGQADPAWTTVLQIADALDHSLAELARRVT